MDNDKRPSKFFYSSEVDRFLSPFGGVIDKMISKLFAGQIDVDSLHIAGLCSGIRSPRS